MTFNFEKHSWCTTLDTNEHRIIAVVKPSELLVLQNTQLWFYKQGAITGDVQLTLHTSTNLSNVYDQTETRSITSFSSGTNFFGYRDFVFNSPNLTKDRTYYIAIKMTSYTPTSSVYFSLPVDGVNTINLDNGGNTAFNGHASKLTIFGLRED